MNVIDQRFLIAPPGEMVVSRATSGSRESDV